ncbi:PH domain-containing protein [Aldersonia kunmingensis]|uniref:PH domain-containing protein n=1 Tax=Aldersonia kunmingensis TaxID=408066 RepID=UPI00082FFCF2|nr:PH domain-containing protein [Aldersonia kunmingensis]
MGYPEDALASEEELLLHCHPHWKMLLLPALTFVVLTAIAGFAIGAVQNNLDGDVRFWLIIAILVIWLALVLWRCVSALVSWKSTHFIVTDRRVLTRQGIITHSGIDIPMGRISSVQFRHGLIDRMVGAGTLIIGSPSEDDLEYDDIPRVQKVHALLYHQVFDAMQLDGDYRDRPGRDDRGDRDRDDRRR